MIEFLTRRVRITAPATSANLGPGFDALGLALARYDTVTAQVQDHGVRVEVTGTGADDLPRDESHLVARAALTAFDRLGGRPPGLWLDCANDIPQARGLGSSSAAIVAGILAARALVVDGAERLPDPAVLVLASELEGHPDNVAPCLLGGLAIAWTDEAGARAVRLSPMSAIRPVLYVPEHRGLTAEARAALPATVPHGDAARNAGRAALLVHALTAAPELLLPATEDRLHQPYRARGMPGTAELVGKLRAAGIAAVVSGAGPAVLALGGPGSLITDFPVPEDWMVGAVEIDAAGARVEVD